jgi:hypothetical protein
VHSYKYTCERKRERERGNKPRNLSREKVTLFLEQNFFFLYNATINNFFKVSF